MSKHVRVLGPSNDDIPTEELDLAKLIQTAESRGLHSIRGSLTDGAHGVCALGCNMYDPDRPADHYYDVPTGNDTEVGKGTEYNGSLGFDLGSAFQQAMSIDAA